MENKVRWVVQSNLGSQKDILALRQACKSNPKVDLFEVTAIPFSEELPYIPEDLPAVIYGATRFVTTAFLANRWQPGVFFNPESFTFDSYRKNYRYHLLNYDAVVLPLSRVVELDLFDSTEVFVRPMDDLKSFPGTIFNTGELKQWAATLLSGDFELKAATEIVVAPKKEIAHEWRLFMVHGLAVAGSHYRSFEKLDTFPEIREDVIRFAEAFDWSPELVYVLDVAEYMGELKVIEANCFNSSGFYAADVQVIVDEVTRVA